MTDMVYHLLETHNPAVRLSKYGPDSLGSDGQLNGARVVSSPERDIEVLGMIGRMLAQSIDYVSRFDTGMKRFAQSIDYVSRFEVEIGEAFRAQQELHGQKCCPKRNGAYVDNNSGFKGKWADFHPRIGSEVGKTKKRVRTPQKYHLCGVVGKKRYHKRNK